MVKYEELVISSGGVYIVHFVGALRALHSYFPINRFKYYTGCSAGAILCLLLVCGYDIEELYDLILKTDITEYQDLKIAHFLESYGFDHGEKVGELFKTLLKAKGFHEHITFLELFEYTHKVLTISVSNITKECAEYHNIFSTPYAKVIDSVLMSMNIPILFKPIRRTITYMGQLQENHYYVDGAIFDPFPWRVMKRVMPHKKLGIFHYRQRNEGNHSPHIMESFQSYFLHLLSMVERDMMREKYKHIKDKQIFYIDDPNIHMIDFQMSADMKRVYIKDTERKFELFYLAKERTHYLSQKYFNLWHYKMKMKIKIKEMK